MCGILGIEDATCGEMNYPNSGRSAMSEAAVGMNLRYVSRKVSIKKKMCEKHILFLLTHNKSSIFTVKYTILYSSKKCMGFESSLDLKKTVNATNDKTLAAFGF